MTPRSPPAAPTSSNAKTAPTPTDTSGSPAPPPATTPGSSARYAKPRCPPATAAPKSSSRPTTRPKSAARPRSPSPLIPAPATARTCPTPPPPGTPATPPCATPSKASTATSKTPPTKPSPSRHAAASAASPPSHSSQHCCSSPPISAKSAPGEHKPPRTKPASPAGHADAGPASPTTFPTANTGKLLPPPPITSTQHGPATPGYPGNRTSGTGHDPEPRKSAPGAQMSDPAVTLKDGYHGSSVGTTPAVLSVTPRGAGGIRTHTGRILSPVPLPLDYGPGTGRCPRRPASRPREAPASKAS